MKLIDLSKTALTAAICALSITAAQAQEELDSVAVDSIAYMEEVDTVCVDSVEVDSIAYVEEADTACVTPERAFDGVWVKSADNAANECRMAINFYKQKSRSTVDSGEEVTLSCYGVIFLGNADGYVPDYCTILTAQLNGDRAAITFKSSRDSNTYSADLVSVGDGSTVRVENVKLRKVVWSPTPQTMLKNGMEFFYTGNED